MLEQPVRDVGKDALAPDIGTPLQTLPSAGLDESRQTYKGVELAARQSFAGHRQPPGLLITREAPATERAEHGIELYPDVVDRDEEVGGVPSRLLKTGGMGRGRRVTASPGERRLVVSGSRAEAGDQPDLVLICSTRAFAESVADPGLDSVLDRAGPAKLPLKTVYRHRRKQQVRPNAPQTLGFRGRRRYTPNHHELNRWRAG
jgi:hypothetical protein